MKARSRRRGLQHGNSVGRAVFSSKGQACRCFCRTKICQTRNAGDWDANVVEVKGKEVKEVDLYSACIVAHTQGAQVRFTQCYLQITPYLPLPRKRPSDGASPD